MSEGVLLIGQRTWYYIFTVAQSSGEKRREAWVMNDKNKSIGAVRLTVDRIIGYLSKSYSVLINSGESLKKHPSVMLWGAPGVGKSQGVRQIAASIEEMTGKRVHVTDVRLLLFNPVDLRGIPTANADKTLAVWLKPQIFQMDDSDGVVNILFLDEISAAPPSVQAAAYQITLDRTVGEHKLPENCIVIAAGNRVIDKSVAYNMPRALANRLCHIEVVADAASWHTWALKAGINRKVVAFLDYSPEFLISEEGQGDGLAYCTPRSWEMVSNMLNCVSERLEDVFPIIVGCIGESAAYSFKVWHEVYAKIPSSEDVFSGKSIPIPTKPEILYALSADILAYAKKNRSEERMKNALAFISKMPREFRNKIFEDLLSVKHMYKVFENNATFDDWFARSGRRWD